MFSHKTRNSRPSSGLSHRECFGKEAYWDRTDPECYSKCRDYEKCKAKVLGMESPEEEGKALTHAGIVKPGETPVERLLKDMLTGVCRTIGWELYDFFRHWRF